VIPLKTSSNIIYAIEIVLIPSFISCLYQAKLFIYLYEPQIWTEIKYPKCYQSLSTLITLAAKVGKADSLYCIDYGFSFGKSCTLTHMHDGSTVKWHDGQNAIVCKILFKILLQSIFLVLIFITFFNMYEQYLFNSELKKRY
jgi:hypothetical protein